MTEPHERSNPEADSGLNFERLVFFSDAVFAIAITLLAIEIRVPEVESAAELDKAIISIIPKIFIFALSFIQVGAFWIGHHRLFRAIARFDERLVWLNLLLLMFVAFVPVPAAALGRHGAELPAVVFFAATLALAGCMELLVWLHASHHRHLLKAGVNESTIALVKWRITALVAVFTVSIAIAYVSPLGAMLSWFTLLILYRLLARRYPDASLGVRLEQVSSPE